jgi:hypothetical protein
VGDDVGNRRERLAVEGGQRTPMHVEPGQLLEDVVRRGVHRRLDRVHERRHALQPLRRHDHRPRPVSRGECAADDLLALGDEHAVRRLDARAERDVGEVAVVRQPVVVRIVDRQSLSADHAQTVTDPGLTAPQCA